MEESVSENKFTVNLSNAAELVSFGIALGISFSLIRNYILYVLILHVPIFQYLDLSDIILIAPSGIFWALYYSSIETANFVIQHNSFSGLEKSFYALSCYVFAGILTWVGFYNEPIVEQGLKFILRNWWFVVPLLLYVSVRLKAIDSKKDFFKKNKYVAAFILTIWYASFDSYASYSVLTQPSRHIHSVIKLKNNQKIIINDKLIYAGRTSNYWFLYNSNTQFIRAIKNEDDDVVDFDSSSK